MTPTLNTQDKANNWADNFHIWQSTANKFPNNVKGHSTDLALHYYNTAWLTMNRFFSGVVGWQESDRYL